MGGGFIGATGGGHQIELRIPGSQSLGFLRIGPREQHLMRAASLGEGGGGAGQRFCRRNHFDSVIANLRRLLVSEHGRDADAEAADLHDPLPRSDVVGEPQQADVGAEKWGRLISHGRHRRHQFLGREPQVIRSEADAGVVHRSQAVGDRLKLHLRLPSKPPHLSPQIDRHHRPAHRLQRLQEVFPPAQAPLLVLLTGAATGFDVAVEFAGEHDDGARLSPSLKHRAVAFLKAGHGLGINARAAIRHRGPAAGRRRIGPRGARQPEAQGDQRAGSEAKRVEHGGSTWVSNRFRRAETARENGPDNPEKQMPSKESHAATAKARPPCTGTKSRRGVKSF